MSNPLSSVETTAKADLTKVESTVKTDIATVESDVKADLAKTYSGKVVAIALGAGLLIGQLAALFFKV